MKKSAAVTLTLVSAMGLAAGSQSGSDPCAGNSFNEQACRTALQDGGYCSTGRWIRSAYSYPYPYYYDQYQHLLLLGGAVTPAPSDTDCQRPRSVIFASGHAARGGFGATGAAHCGTAGA